MATRTAGKIKVRYRNGVFEPLEPVRLPEGSEGEVVVSDGFFELLDEARANVERSGVTEEEFGRIVEEVCREARKRTGERMRKAAADQR